MHKVAILAYEKLATFELSCAIEIFALSRPEYENWYQTEVVSFESQPIKATGGISIYTKCIDSLVDYDTLIIPSWNIHNKHVRLDMAEKISQFAESGKRIISFCSGAFLLAQLGLLQNLKATTHWRYADIFKQRFPQVNYVNDVLYTQDGNMSCSAGSAAALDLGIEIVRQDFGHKIANQVARRLVVSPHRSGGQSQYIETPIIKQNGAFSGTLDWAIENMDAVLTVDDMAERANMSRRSFDRHFKNALGTSPKIWLNQQRINLAKQLLETESLSVDQLALRVGYENSITFRFNFNKFVGVAPSQYQAQFNVSK
ncbi:helix-turn-helix domain-containing protein [Paraglaciecola aquimarina]|uniref:Helix-turn-helix domain-containing protein n=1 Tax=Paraglaciecola aquimarina TaxID=1235557 RepID=A0ABU3T1F9_9ALTE|nr:helix-turn-helix domain-containing protein [Paraglaciecola aquimarina]MDU0356057.1 helix-turn-helix domain-containing protein [Paraglaciecola aquimarina]